MVELLAAEKRRLLAENGMLTGEDFETAWCECWMVMVSERAWPHATEHRRHWRVAMIATKSEMRAAFLGQPTSFATLATGFTVAARRLRVELTAEDLPTVILGAIQAGYSVADTQPGEGIAA